MDVSKYKNEFISEARDHLDSLNKDLVVLEKDPNNDEVIHSLFRSFHTLKGNAAAMGYTKFSELAHSLEDALSKIKDKELTLTSDFMSIIFEGCDALEDGLQKISQDTPEDITVEHIISEVKAAIGVKDVKIDVKMDSRVVLTDTERNALQSANNNGFGNNYRIIIVFDASNVLKTAKTLLTLKLLNKDYAQDMIILKTNPAIEAIREGKFGAEIEVVLSTRKNRDEVSTIINKISGIREVHVLGLDEEYVKSVNQLHIEKESGKQEIITKHQEEVVKNIQSVKVDMDKLDKLMNLVGELLISNM